MPIKIQTTVIEKISKLCPGVRSIAPESVVGDFYVYSAGAFDSLASECQALPEIYIAALQIRPKSHGLFRTAIEGAIGLTKYVAQQAGLPVEETPPEVVAERRRICEACELLSHKDQNGKMTLLSRCDPNRGGCPCFMTAKTPLASHSCPLGKWWPYKPGRSDTEQGSNMR